MKKITMLAAAASLVILSGCASVKPTGIIYTDVKVPEIATGEAMATQTGIAKCKSWCGMVVIGDASVEAAKKNGGITKVASVDWKAKSICGIIAEYECIVKGE